MKEEKGKRKGFLKRFGAVVLASLCLVTTAQAIGNSLSASAAADVSNTSKSLNGQFATSNEIIAQASQLLGVKYRADGKGYNDVVLRSDAGAYTYKQLLGTGDKAIPPSNRGVDCSGLPYWTFRTLGYYSTGFIYQNGLPLDSYQYTQDTSTVKKIGKKNAATMNKGIVKYEGGTQAAGYTSKNTKVADLEPVIWQKVSTEDKRTDKNKICEWWKTLDGKIIEPGSFVIGDDGSGQTGNSYQEHCWIYIGKFNSAAECAAYIEKITKNTERPLTASYLLNTNCGGNVDNGTSSSNKLVMDKTRQNYKMLYPSYSDAQINNLVANDTKFKYWRIESNGTDGVCINNGISGKNANVLKVSTFTTNRDVGHLKITKYIDPLGEAGAVVANSTNYPDYTKIKFALQVVNVDGLTAGKYVRFSRASDNTYLYDNSVQYTNYTDNEGATPNIVNTNGTIELTNLPLGTYKLVEATDFAALGLKPYTAENIVISKDTTTDASGYITKNVTNTPVPGTLTVTKTSSNTLGVKDAELDASVKANAEFMIYDTSTTNDGKYIRATGSNGTYKYAASDRYSPSAPEASQGTHFKLGSNGTFTVTDLPKDHKYTVVEVKTDASFKITNASVNVEFAANSNTANVSFDNARKGATMTVVKTGKKLDGSTYTANINDKDYPELAKKLNEAVEFKIYDWNGKYVKATGSNGAYTFASANSAKADGTTFKLGADGTFAIEKLPTTPEGKKYFAEEIKTANGFKLVDPVGIVLTTNASNPIENEQYPTSFEVDKKFILGTVGGGKITDQMYEKIEFVAKNSSGKYIIASIGENAGEYTKTAYTTDKSKATVMHLDAKTHIAKVTNVEQDTYTAEEMVDESIFTATKKTGTVESSESGENKIEFINTELTGGIEIYKKTKTMHNISGIKLHIYGTSNSGRAIDIQTAETDANGYVYSEGIPYGTYQMEEVRETVDENYDLIKPQTIVIDKPFVKDENKKEILNDFRSGEVNIIKQDKNGTKLAGFEFTLTAAEDIYEGAKEEENLLYKEGDKIEVITTGDDGSGKSAMVLPFGYKYTLTETKAVAPYNMDAEPITFTLKEQKNKSVYVVETEMADVSNNLNATPTEQAEPLEVLTFEDSQQEGKLTIYKTDDRNNKVYLDGAEFDVIALEDIVVNGKVEYKENDVVKHVVTKNGKAEVKLYTNFNYGLKETKAPQGYVLAEDITKVNMKYEANLLYTEQNVSVTNGRQTGELTIYKVDKDNNKVFLEGAEFDVIAKTDITVSGDEHKAGDVLAHVKTGKDGKASLTLWAGYTYVLKETKAPYGYDKLDKVIEVSVDYNPNIKYTETNVRVENKKKPEAPKTGVTNSIVPVCIAGGIALVAFGAVVVLMKKKKSNSK